MDPNKPWLLTKRFRWSPKWVSNVGSGKLGPFSFQKKSSKPLTLQKRQRNLGVRMGWRVGSGPNGTSWQLKLSELVVSTGDASSSTSSKLLLSFLSFCSLIWVPTVSPLKMIMSRIDVKHGMNQVWDDNFCIPPSPLFIAWWFGIYFAVDWLCFTIAADVSFCFWVLLGMCPCICDTKLSWTFDCVDEHLIFFPFLFCILDQKILACWHL
jgi:hypothetical protein